MKKGILQRENQLKLLLIIFHSWRGSGSYPGRQVTMTCFDRNHSISSDGLPSFIYIYFKKWQQALRANFCHKNILAIQSIYIKLDVCVYVCNVWTPKRLGRFWWNFQGIFRIFRRVTLWSLIFDFWSAGGGAWQALWKCWIHADFKKF